MPGNLYIYGCPYFLPINTPLFEALLDDLEY
jgi:hypothetical protein